MWIFIGDVPIWFEDNDDGPGMEPFGPVMAAILYAMLIGGIGFGIYIWLYP